MTKVRVRREYVFDLPDHVRIEEPVEEGGEMLFLHRRFLVPDVGWMALCEIGDGPGVMTTEQLPDELKGVLADALSEVLTEEIQLVD